MKNKKEFLDVDFIGGLGSLTKEDEAKLNAYFKNKKKTKAKELQGRVVQNLKGKN